MAITGEFIPDNNLKWSSAGFQVFLSVSHAQQGPYLSIKLNAACLFFFSGDIARGRGAYDDDKHKMHSKAQRGAKRNEKY